VTSGATTGTDLELASQLRMGVMRLARRLRHEGSGFELTASQLSALATVDKAGPLTLGELAQREHVRPPSMTRIVAALEAAGLVSRSPDPSDGRVASVAVTRAGRAQVQSARRKRDAWLDARLHDLPADDRAALARAADVMERLARS
jgi:DNA-binding MarR family transcriptional regulator